MAGLFFEKNIAALKALNPEQARTILDLSPQVENRLYQTKPHGEGFTNLYYPSDGVSTFALFSTGNPENEIQNWLFSTDLEKSAPHAVILLGFDLGYYPKTTLERLPENSLLAIVEPDPLLFFTAIHHTDIADLIGDRRVHLYVGQKLNKAVESLGAELKWSRFLTLSYKILVNPLLRKCLRSFPQDFSTQFRNALQRETMYRTSRVEHGTTVVMNTIKNSEFLLDAPGVSTLFGQFPKIPAVLAAAGPSLEKNLDTLQRFQDRVLMTCVNTAYPVLRKHGITPHVVFTMDHQERNFRSFEGDTGKPKSFLIADPRIHPSIIGHFMPNVFFASWRATTETVGEPVPLDQVPVPHMSGNAIYLWLQELTGSKGDVYGPGSVAVAGFHILARMGCQPIVLAGQDLAFSGNKTYAGGTIFEDKHLPQDSDAAHWIESVDGGAVATSETLFLYRQLLEHEIARFQIPVINTSGGAVIKGSIASSLDSLLSQWPPLEIDFFAFLRQILESNPSRIIFRDLIATLQHGIEKLEEFAAEAKSGLNQVPDTLGSLSKVQKQALLDTLKKRIETCSTTMKPALELLNELLQESHFEYEEGQWNLEKVTDSERRVDEEIHACTRVLDAFVRQATLLGTLFEEKISEIG